MKITITVKPVIYKARTKQEALDKALRNKSITFGNHGHAFKINYGLMGEDHYLFTYTIQKHNAKWVQTRYKSGPKKGQYKSSVKIKDKEWVVYLYKFDIELLKLANIKLNQKDKTFTYMRTK